MANPFSCAIAARRAGEDLVGTAGHFQTYVLIECPMPWPAKAFNSSSIPSALRQYIKALKTKQSVRFLCISRGIASPPAHTTVLVYERDALAQPLTAKVYTANQFAGGYRGYEYQLNSLDQVVPCLEAHWCNQQQPQQLAKLLGRVANQQDILVCTHGMRDRCCARFGQPFFRDARRLAAQGHLPNARIWQVSHIGGHRFAPTAISLPDGRYYGWLTLSALRAIITRSGSIDQLRSTYRGWSLLPPSVQVLEQQLLLSQGWSWLNNKIIYQAIASPLENNPVPVQLFVQQPDGKIIKHWANLMRDTEQPNCVKASCGSALPSTFIKYVVTEHTFSEHLQPAKAPVR